MRPLHTLCCSFLLASLVTDAWACAMCSSRIEGLDGLPDNSSTDPAITIRLVSQVKWQKLNPARGDKSPQAGTLWGDRKGKVATGFLAKFIDGFSSPPHIHNVSYRAVVIHGLVHNDDPDAAQHWMPTGSFWTQPKGETHITAAKGKLVVALVEIDEGPYLVQPPASAFDSGERPINIDAKNVVWVHAPSQAGQQSKATIAYLWGKPNDGAHGSFLRLPAGFTGVIQTAGGPFRAVVISGQLKHAALDKQDLEAGSLFTSTKTATHSIANQQATDCLVYINAAKPYQLAATP